MKKIESILLFLLFLKLSAIGQTVPLGKDGIIVPPLERAPRVPSEKAGDFVLYKSDTLIISYHWEQYFNDQSEAHSYYVYMLSLSIKNLLKDSIQVKFKLFSNEAFPRKHTSNIEFTEYTYVTYEPLKESDWLFFLSNCGDIVDFYFKRFTIKFNNGKKIELAKKLNKNKSDSIKHFLH